MEVNLHFSRPSPLQQLSACEWVTCLMVIHSKKICVTVWHTTGTDFPNCPMLPRTVFNIMHFQYLRHKRDKINVLKQTMYWPSSLGFSITFHLPPPYLPQLSYTLAEKGPTPFLTWYHWFYLSQTRIHR